MNTPEPINIKLVCQFPSGTLSMPQMKNDRPRPWTYYVSERGKDHGYYITDGTIKLMVTYAWQAKEICEAHNKALRESLPDQIIEIDEHGKVIPENFSPYQ